MTLPYPAPKDDIVGEGNPRSQATENFGGKIIRYRIFLLLAASFVLAFVARTLLAVHSPMPRLFDMIDSLTVVGALVACLSGFRNLRRSDWITALGLGAVVGVGMLYATLFSAYPLFDVARAKTSQALVRGLFTLVAALGGLVIMRQGGSVPLRIASCEWKKLWRGILLGLAVGLPLAVVNVFALQATGGHGIVWQNPMAALLDALQPGIVEEVIYRFALWGLLWMALRRTLPERAALLSGLLATLVHAFAHFDGLLVESPLVALGMGLVMTIIWGLPPLFLARRRGLESAIAFHWMQDVARFITGF